MIHAYLWIRNVRQGNFTSDINFLASENDGGFEKMITNDVRNKKCDLYADISTIQRNNVQLKAVQENNPFKEQENVR